MDPEVPLGLFLAAIVAFAAVRFSGQPQFAVVYWGWSWTAMISAGAVLAFSPGIELTALALLAASAFAPLQAAGAYNYRGEAAPSWIIPLGVALGGTRVAILATLGHAPSHIGILPGELALLAWSAYVLLRKGQHAPETMNRVLALGAIALGALETVDAVLDLGPTSGTSVQWSWWITIGSFIGMLQLVGARERVALRRAEAQRELEERERTADRLESLGVMAGGIAHDFNNMLTSILGHTELALDDLPQGHPSHEHVTAAMEGALRAARLSTQMLAYASHHRFAVAPIDLAKSISEQEGLLRAAVDSSVDLTLSVRHPIPLILADKVQLDQLILNLVRNASEASTPRGHIELRTDVVDLAAPIPAVVIGELSATRYVRLHVSDTGAGIDAADHSKIFDPFYSTKFPGRGMGLAVAQRIVTGHNGAIAIHSSAGAGTTVSIYFPASNAQLE